jgi:hypothetical protein
MRVRKKRFQKKKFFFLFSSFRIRHNDDVEINHDDASFYFLVLFFSFPFFFSHLFCSNAHTRLVTSINRMDERVNDHHDFLLFTLFFFFFICLCVRGESFFFLFFVYVCRFCLSLRFKTPII